MDLGKAWIIIEESHHSNEKHLISIISIRRNSEYVCDFVEQSYVDKYASFDEKIAYKKNKKKSPFHIESYEKSYNRITCGHDPVFSAYRCEGLHLDKNVLKFKYRVHKGNIETHTSSIHKGWVNVS